MSTNIKKIIEEKTLRALEGVPFHPEACEAPSDIGRALAETITECLSAHVLRVALIELEGELPKNIPSPATLADVEAIFSLANAEPLSEVKRKVAELLDTFKRDRNWSDMTLYESQANAQRLMFKIAELEQRVRVAEEKAAAEQAERERLAALAEPAVR